MSWCKSGARTSRFSGGALRFALALVVAVPPPFLFPVPAASAAQAPPPAVHPYAAYVSEAAQRFGIPEAWIWAVMHVESRGNPRAVSPVGAMGLMQIMPATWTMLSARFGLGSEPFAPRANIHAGAAYLRLMGDRYGDISAMLAAYNAGPGRVDDWRAHGRQLPAETVAYVAQIAPAIGGPGVTAPVTAPAEGAFAAAPSWRDAGLFMARSDAARASANGDPADTGERAVPQGPAAPAPTLSPPPSAAPVRSESSLFVSVSGGGKQ